MAKTDLYRHFDKDGRLLYVGISKCAWGRFAEHCDQSYWAGSSARMTIETFATRVEAETAERRAIGTEQPIFNVTHNRDAADRWLAAYVPPPSRRKRWRHGQNRERMIVKMPWPNPFLVK